MWRANKIANCEYLPDFTDRNDDKLLITTSSPIWLLEFWFTFDSTNFVKHYGLSKSDEELNVFELPKKLFHNGRRSLFQDAEHHHVILNGQRTSRTIHVEGLVENTVKRLWDAVLSEYRIT